VARDGAGCGRDSGFLLVDKPEGMTSRRALDAVLRARGRRMKGGYEGTLDPFAGGLLLVGLERATRFLRYFHSLPKKYTALVRLGVETDTLDPEGGVVDRGPVPSCDAASLHKAASRFTGEIEQVPPSYAALKKNGKRGYDLARRGEAVSFPPRRVTVHELVLEETEPGILRMRCTVSAGTYVRALARDIARALGTVGYLAALRRTAIGDFSVEEASPPQAAGEAPLLPMEEALAHHPAAFLSAAEAATLRAGRCVDADREPGVYRLMGPEGFFGMGACRDGRLCPERLLPVEDVSHPNSMS